MTNRVIWKYAINPGRTATLGIPKWAEVRHVGFDGLNDLCVWLSHDAARPRHNVRFTAVGTGRSYDEHIGTPIGSAVDPQSREVWHVFMRIGNPE